MNPMILCVALSLSAACGTGEGKGDTADDTADDTILTGGPCEVNGEIVAASDDCDQDAATVTEQCDSWADLAELSGCEAEFEAWQICNNEWISDPPAGLTVACTEDGVSFQSWYGDEIEDPCEDLNVELNDCWDLGI